MGDLLHFSLPLIGQVDVMAAAAPLAAYRALMVAFIWLVWVQAVIALGTRFLGLGGQVPGEMMDAFAANDLTDESRRDES